MFDKISYCKSFRYPLTLCIVFVRIVWGVFFVKICVFSDTHGDITGMDLVIPHVNPDMIIHLGDYASDAAEIDYMYPDIGVLSVCGNCDRDRSAGFEKVTELGGKRFYLVHGNQFNMSRARALYAPCKDLADYARDLGVDIVLFGHTHSPLTALDGDLLLMNPGSASMDRYESKAPTFGLIDLGEKNIALKIMSIELFK